MNLESLQEEIGRQLSDPSHDRWTLDVLTTRINIIQTQIQGQTNAIKTPEVLTPVAGQRTLTLDADTMDIIRASKTDSGGNIKPFIGMGREELDFLYPNWQQWSGGEPLYWWYDATNQQVNIVPVPDTGNAITDGMTFWESRKPADLVNSTDIPFDSNNQMVPYHMAIVHGVVALCFQDDGTPEALTKSKFHSSGSMLSPGEYEKWIGKIQAEFDAPAIIPSRVLFLPQGGRVGTWYIPNKSNPLGGW